MLGSRVLGELQIVSKLVKPAVSTLPPWVLHRNLLEVTQGVSGRAGNRTWVSWLPG